MIFAVKLDRFVQFYLGKNNNYKKLKCFYFKKSIFIQNLFYYIVQIFRYFHFLVEIPWILYGFCSFFSRNSFFIIWCIETIDSLPNWPSKVMTPHDYLPESPRFLHSYCPLCYRYSSDTITNEFNSLRGSTDLFKPKGIETLVLLLLPLKVS